MLQGGSIAMKRKVASLKKRGFMGAPPWVTNVVTSAKANFHQIFSILGFAISSLFIGGEGLTLKVSNWAKPAQ